eukprot:14545813-Ditylum_brightwellii.AAC.1
MVEPTLEQFGKWRQEGIVVKFIPATMLAKTSLLRSNQAAVIGSLQSHLSTMPMKLPSRTILLNLDLLYWWPVVVLLMFN